VTAQPPAASRPRGRERARLNRETVLAEALALADADGLDGLGMRPLSQRLGVVPMALYKHVANKEDLLDGMIDLVWAEVEMPDTKRGWRTSMGDRSRSLRQALTRHPWAIGLMEARLRPGFANLAQHNAMMGCLRGSGFSFRTTVHVTSTLDAFVYGFALQERSLPFDTAEQSGGVAEQKLQDAPPEAAAAFPHLLEVVRELGAAGYDYDTEFETGLALVLDAVEGLRPEWRADPPSP
jgi:AcrR family transcriptional regulator